jgi:hypothetical protein
LSQSLHGSIETSLSAVVRQEAASFLLLRNCRGATENSSNLRYGTPEQMSFLAARLEDGLLNMVSDDSPDRLRFPGEISSLMINGTPVAYDSLEDLVIITGPM